MDIDRNREIDDELKGLSKTLFDSLSKPRIYDIPDGYFEQVEEIVLAQYRVTEALEPESTQSLSDKFFEQQEDKIIEALQKKKKGKIPSWLFAAASFLLLLLFVFNQDKKSATDLLEGKEMAFVYLDENDDDWDIEEMINQELIDESTLATWNADETNWMDSLSADYLTE